MERYNRQFVSLFISISTSIYCRCNQYQFGNLFLIKQVTRVSYPLFPASIELLQVRKQSIPLSLSIYIYIFLSLYFLVYQLAIAIRSIRDLEQEIQLTILLAKEYKTSNNYLKAIECYNQLLPLVANKEDHIMKYKVGIISYHTILSILIVWFRLVDILFHSILYIVLTIILLNEQVMEEIGNSYEK